MTFDLGAFVAITVVWIVVATVLVFRVKRRHVRRGLSVRVRLHWPFFSFLLAFELSLATMCLRHATGVGTALFVSAAVLVALGFAGLRRRRERGVASLVVLR